VGRIPPKFQFLGAHTPASMGKIWRIQESTEGLLYTPNFSPIICATSQTSKSPPE